MSGWTVEMTSIALEEFSELPEDMQAKYIRIAELIETNGPALVREPYVKPSRRWPL